jgi:hypothetical protein
MEVRAHFQSFDDQVTDKEVAAAFRSGEEVRLRDFTTLLVSQMKSLEACP